MTDQQPTPNTAPTAGAARWRAVGHWLRDTGLGITGFLIVLAVALSGWTASFIGLHQFGQAHMALTDHEAWLVPVTFDGAAAGLSLVVFRASINGRGASAWRLLIVAFTTLSSWINYVHISDPTGRLIASFMPPAAVILFEGLMSEARAAAARRDGRERARVHPLRWVFDWSGTMDLYRNYVMGVELPGQLNQSATEAVAVERHETATDGAPETATVAPSDRTTQRSESATVAQPQEDVKRSHGDTGSATKPPRKAAPKRSKPSDRDTAKVAIEALYGALGRRPVESEMVAELKRIKVKYTSPAFAKKIRDEIEKADPALAALGTDNVRPLTG